MLPIRNVERGKFVDLDSSNKISREFGGYIGLSLRLLLQIISTTFFVLLDLVKIDLKYVSLVAIVSYTKMIFPDFF